MSRLTRSSESKHVFQRYYPKEYRHHAQKFHYGTELILFLIVLGVVWLVATVSAHGQTIDCQPTNPAGSQPFVRDGDQVWLVSTRHMENCGKVPVGDITFQTESLDGDTWQQSQLKKLSSEHQSNSALQTIVYFHGNRTDNDWSRSRGVEVYQRLTANNCPPVRFIIWSWPSDRILRPLKDFRVKADRSIAEGSYFAAFLNEIGSENPIGLFGYSLGCQVIMSGLDEYAAQQAAGQGSQQALASGQFKIVLMAAAMDCNWPTLCDDVDAIYRLIDQMLIIHNSCDRALLAYQLACMGSITAMGSCGMKGLDAISDGGTKVRHLDVSNLVGSEHSISQYVEPDSVVDSIRKVLVTNRQTKPNTMVECSARKRHGPVVRVADRNSGK